MSLILLVLQIIISILLIIVILLQRSNSDGFGLGASGGSNFLSSRGQANLMTKITSILAAAFMANSLLLATVNARSSADSIADEIMLEQSKNRDFQVPIEAIEGAVDNKIIDKNVDEKNEDVTVEGLTNKDVKIESPKIEAPSTETPSTETPAMESPKINTPKAEQKSE